VLAPSLLARAAIPGFVARGRGTLINISSALALAPERFNGSYSGTKAYLLNLSLRLRLRLRREVERKGVRVQVVLPGATRTAIWEKVGTDIAKPAF
jgi:short-subunit dehydrogenase